MKGYLWSSSAAANDGPGKLARWEAMATDAVGNVIEFWGFKRNMGRVWALLYLRDASLTAAEIERELGLSKGGVSMLIRDLERWGVVHRVRPPGDASWHYRAETDLVRMATRVVEERESEFVARVRADLAEARRLAEQNKVGRERLARLGKMAALAEQADKALKAFVKTARLELGGMFGIFRG